MTVEEFEKHLDSLTDEEFFQRGEEKPVTFDPETTERNNGPTPSGGAYSVAYFYDEYRRPCSRQKAKYMNIVEYDKDGNRINENYGIL